MCFTVNLLQSEGSDRCGGFYCKTTLKTVTNRKLTLPKVDLKADLTGIFLNFAKDKTDHILYLTKQSPSEKQQWLQILCRSYVVISFDFVQQDEVVNSLDEKVQKF